MRRSHVLLVISTAILMRCDLCPGGGGVEPDPNNTPPTVKITAPLEDQQFDVYQPISFAGSATDPEDGSLSSALRWYLTYAQPEVQIGTGPAFPYDNFPAVGRMKVEARAQDINGGIGNAIRNFWVLVGGELVFDRNNETEIRRTDGHPDILVTSGGNPAWSPDGKRIAFVRDVGGQAEVFIRDLSTNPNVETRVTTNAVDDYAPAWSPDGLWLAYVSNVPATGGGVNPEILLVTLATGFTVSLTNNLADDDSPAWSAIGIVFASDRAAGGDFDIFFVPGNNLAAPATQLTGNNVDDKDPHWTPNGRIVFSSGPPDLNGMLQPHDILIMDALAGAPATNLTNDPANDRQPDMSPDGQRIAFISNRSGNEYIWLMRTTSPARPVRVDLAGINVRHPRWKPVP